MSDVVIKVENLSKLYRLGEVGTGTLSQDLKRWWATTRGKEDPFAKVGEANDRTKKGNSGFVWALKDVNFEVRKGEVLGIIGRNGAGKSTLLKLLSKVTTPSTGSVKVKGRIASLLEVGTGFHPDLTGRENVFLNGAILGMTKSEIRSKFDEIVDFAGVERYIDTPVKRYSSGMYVRLAFAVAAFLEPEILIVDEVLAVGDAEFQKKCLGRMKDVSVNDGRTVLFVSHNMGAMKSLCTSGLFMKEGSVAFRHHSIEQVVNRYYETIQFSETQPPISERTDRQGNGDVFIEALELMNSVDNSQLELGKPIGFKIVYNAKPSSFVGKILVSINNSNGECVLFMDSTTIKGFPLSLGKSGKIEIKVSQDFGLPVGRYFINVAFFADNHLADYVQSALVLNVVDGLFYEGGKLPVGKTLCYVQQQWNYTN